MKKLSYLPRTASAIVIVFCMCFRANAETKPKDNTTAASKPTATAPATGQIIAFAGLQATIPGNKTGDVLFYSHDKFATEADAIAHANKVLKVPCRAATADEIAALNKAHDKDRLYRAATKLGLGQGDASSYKLNRNAVTVILTQAKVARSE